MDAPKRIWINYSLANKRFLAFPGKRMSEAYDCRDAYVLVTEHERVVAELRAQRDRAFELADKAREDGLARAANVREAFCYASPGSYEEFRSFLVGFDSAIRAMKGE